MSEKVRDDKNRWRSRTIAFRMSEGEEAELNDRVKLLGYRTKQDYMIEAVLKNEVHAMGNPQMMIQFKKDLRAILVELERLNNISEIGEDTMMPIRTMLEIMEAFKQAEKKVKKEKPVEKPQYDKMMHLSKLKKIMLKEEANE